MSFEIPPTTDPDLTTRRRGRAEGGREGESAEPGVDPQNAGAASPNDDSGSTVISKKPPQQFCTSGFDWRKVGELLIGKQLGTFRLDSLLGVGGMGAVFRATDLQLHREVAVKVLNSSENDPEAERRFRVEAQSAARLDHQHIARVFHVGQDQGWNYIVLELVEGQTLRQLVTSRGPLSLKLAIHFFRQLASALDHAHQRNIIHRDIKPSNVLITDDHVIKIVDMGLARIQRSADSVDQEAEEGMTLGTFDYLAPEQARDARQADQQSDLYSLGCTLFYTLVGRPPFADGTTIEKILSHSNSPRPSILEARPDLPPAVDRLVQNLMAARREDRIGTAKELEQRLLDLRWELSRTARPVSNRPATDAVRRVPLMFVALMIALFAVALVWDGGWKTTEITMPEWPSAPPLTNTSELTSEETNIDPSTSKDGSLVIPDNKGLENKQPSGRSEGSLPSNSNTIVSNSGNPDSILTESLDSPLSGRVRSDLSEPNGLAVPASSETRDSSFRSLTSDFVFPFLSSEDGLNGLRRDWWLLPGAINRMPTPTDSATNVRTDRSDSATLPQVPSETSEAERDLITTISVVPAAVSGPAIVATELPGVAANVVQVDSLQLAIESLKQFPNVRRIELNFSGVHRVSIPSWNLGGVREIRAAANQQPILLFVDPERASVTGEEYRFRVDGGNLEVTGIAFIWETLANRHGALFEIIDTARVTFSECTFQHVVTRPRRRPADVSTKLTSDQGTTPIGQQDGRLLNSEWVRLAPMSETNPNQKPGVLSFTRCAMHGSANGIEASSGRGTLVRWTDCLLISAGSAIQFDQSAVTTERLKFEIECTRSSILACRGILAMLESPSRTGATVSMYAQDSVLVSGDLAIGLFHQQSMADQVSSLPNGLRNGSSNVNNSETYAESFLSFDGFSNTFVAGFVWTRSDRSGEILASADATQIRMAKWFQQELASTVTMTPPLGVESFNLTLEPAANLTEVRWRTAIGQNNSEHGVSFAKLPQFPTLLNSATQ